MPLKPPKTLSWAQLKELHSLDRDPKIYPVAPPDGWILVLVARNEESLTACRFSQEVDEIALPGQHLYFTIPEDAAVPFGF